MRPASDPVRTPAHAIHTVAVLLAAGAALAALPIPLRGQALPDAGDRAGLTVTLHAGGTAFTRFQDVTLEAQGTPQLEYPADIAASTAASLGADLTLWLRPWLGARLDFLYSPTNFELRLTEEDRVEVLGEESDYRGFDYSDLSIYSVMLAGVLALPVPASDVATYALLGAGATMLRADDRGAHGLERAFSGGGIAFDVAAIGGIGVKIPLRGGTAGRVALSFEVVDRITRTPIRANEGSTLREADDMRILNRLHTADIEGDTRWVHGVGIAAGLSFSTGSRTPSDAVTE